MKCSCGIRSEHPVPGVEVYVRGVQVGSEVGPGRVVVHEVEASPATGHLGHHGLDTSSVGHIADETSSFVTLGDQQLGEAVRLQVRPSGTEPKVKLYAEGIGEDPAPLLQQLAELLG